MPFSRARQKALPAFRTIGASPPANSAPVTSSGSCSYRPPHVTPRPYRASTTTTPSSRPEPPPATPTYRPTATDSRSSAAPKTTTPETTPAPPSQVPTRASPSTGWAAPRSPTNTGLLRRLLGQRVQYPRQRRVGRQQHQHTTSWGIALGPAAGPMALRSLSGGQSRALGNDPTQAVGTPDEGNPLSSGIDYAATQPPPHVRPLSTVRSTTRRDSG